MKTEPRVESPDTKANFMSGCLEFVKCNINFPGFERFGTDPKREWRHGMIYL